MSSRDVHFVWCVCACHVLASHLVPISVPTVIQGASEIGRSDLLTCMAQNGASPIRLQTVCVRMSG